MAILLLFMDSGTRIRWGYLSVSVSSNSVIKNEAKYIRFPQYICYKNTGQVHKCKKWASVIIYGFLFKVSWLGLDIWVPQRPLNKANVYKSLFFFCKDHIKAPFFARSELLPRSLVGRAGVSSQGESGTTLGLPRWELLPLYWCRGCSVCACSRTCVLCGSVKATRTLHCFVTYRMGP